MYTDTIEEMKDIVAERLPGKPLVWERLDARDGLSWIGVYGGPNRYQGDFTVMARKSVDPVQENTPWFERWSIRFVGGNVETLFTDLMPQPQIGG